MMNGNSMSEMLREAMEKKKGGQNSFSMAGQYTSPVERDGDREFVMYDAPNGEQVKVYGNWNEYAVAEDENGGMMIADEDYPIVEDENGDFVLDEATFEGQSRGQQMRNEAQGGPGASETEDLMEMLNQSRGQGGAQAPGMKYGGKIYEHGGEIHDDRRRITVSTRKQDGMVQPTFFSDGEPVSPRQAANIYKADYLRETESRGAGAPDFNQFAQNAIMRSLAAKGKAGGMRDTVRQQSKEFREDREKAGVKGLLRGLSNYRR